MILAMTVAGAFLLILFAAVGAGQAQVANGQDPLPSAQTDNEAPYHAGLDDERFWVAAEQALHEGDRARLAVLDGQLTAAEQDTLRAMLEATETGDDFTAGVTELAPDAADVGINGNPCSYTSIGNAISAAADGDTIYIPSGNTYFEQLGSIGKDLTLIASLGDCSGPDPAATSTSVHIDGSGNSGGIWGGIASVNPGHTVTFTHITLENATANYGGILYVDQDARVVLDNSEVADGAATTFGGGVRVYIGGALVMKNDSYVHRNEVTGAGDGGGVAVYQGALTMTTDSTVGLGAAGSNQAGDQGGGVHLHSARLYMNDADILNNQAITAGGGLFAMGVSQVVMEQRARIGGYSAGFGNSAPYGGGAYVTGNGGISLDSFSGLVYNSAGFFGGGAYAESNAYVALQGGSEVLSNTADLSGGGLYLTDENTRLNIIGSGGEVVGNYSPGLNIGYGGGGIYATDGAAVYGENAQIDDNRSDWYGGGILVAQDSPVVTPTDVILINSELHGNEADTGGGLFIRDHGSRVVVQDSDVSANRADDGVGGAVRMLANSTMTLTQGTVISGNVGGLGGGLSLLDGRMTITDVQIVHNTGITRAGGIHMQGGNVEAYDPLIRYNAGASFGGGIYHEGGGLYLAAVNKEGFLSDNTAAEGAGLYELSSSGTTIDAGNGYRFNLTGNSARGSGGAAYLRGHTPLIAHGEVVVSGNEAQSFHGGAFYLREDATVWLAPTGAAAPVLVDNTASLGDGGAFYATISSHVRLQGVTMGHTLVPNSAQDGGAIFATAGSDVTVEESEVVGNEASNDGGAFYLSRSRADVTRTRFLSNTATGGGVSNGSALMLSREASARVTNSLFSGNNETTVHVYADAAYESDSSTYAGNSSIPLYVVQSAAGVTLTNNVIWDNGSSAYYQSGAPLTTQCNDTQLALGGPGDISADPQFVTTSAGPYRLGLGSPAIDACSSGPAVDLEGASRPKDGDGFASGSEFDMGAFEHGTIYRLNLPLTVKQLGP